VKHQHRNDEPRDPARLRPDPTSGDDAAHDRPSRPDRQDPRVPVEPPDPGHPFDPRPRRPPHGERR
jgi:hypothetical protein